MSFMFTSILLAPQVSWGPCETAHVHVAQAYTYWGTPSLENPNLLKLAPSRHVQSFPRMETLSLLYWLGNKSFLSLKGDEIDPEGQDLPSADRWFIAMPALGSYLPRPSPASLPNVLLSYAILSHCSFLSLKKFYCLHASIVYLSILLSMFYKTFRKIVYFSMWIYIMFGNFKSNTQVFSLGHV